MVLLLVFATFVFLSAAPDTEWASVVSILLQGATLLFAMRVSKSRPLYIRIAELGVAVALLVAVGSVLADGKAAKTTVRLVSVMVVSITPLVIGRSIVHSLVSQRRVTLQSIFGVVSIYLLLGMLFAFIFAAIGAANSGEFFASDAAGNTQNFMYFSFTTLTTVGYGDLTAARQFARTLAVSEALFGQIYLIAVLSLFVSNLRPRHPIERE